MLESDDTLITRADGLTEVINQSEAHFGDAWPINALRESRGFEPTDILNRPLESVDVHRADALLSDDLTLLLLRRMIRACNKR